MDPAAASRIQSSEARAEGGGLFLVYSTFTKSKVLKGVDSHQEPNQQLLNTRQQDLVKQGHKEMFPVVWLPQRIQLLRNGNISW